MPVDIGTFSLKTLDIAGHRSHSPIVDFRLWRRIRWRRKSPLSSEEQQALTEYQQALGGQPLNLSTSQIRSTLNARRNAADRLFATDVISTSFAGRNRYTTNCAGAACTVLGVRVGLSDLDFNDADYASLMARHGVSVIAGEQEVTYADGTRTHTLGLGGWLSHNAFFIEFDTLADANNVAGELLFYGVSFGNDTGSNPSSGSATWTGVMVGLDSIDIQAIQGDATAQADFAAANLDISFTNIHDDDLNRRSDIRWNDVGHRSPLSGYDGHSRTGVLDDVHDPGRRQPAGSTPLLLRSVVETVVCDQFPVAEPLAPHPRDHRSHLQDGVGFPDVVPVVELGHVAVQVLRRHLVVDADIPSF